jgi:hypothetical protein
MDDAAEQEAAAVAKELKTLNTSAKGYRTSFTGSRKTLQQALPLYLDGPTQSRRQTIDECLAKIGAQAEKVHNAYQKLIELDENQQHLDLYDARQQTNMKELNDIRQQADEILGEVDGPQVPQQQQQQQANMQGDIVQATVAAMTAANGNQNGQKKIDYHLKPKILGNGFTTSELRTWCSGMAFFWAAQDMENREVGIRWANFYDCMHQTQKNYFQPRLPPRIGVINARNLDDDHADHRTALEIIQLDHETKWPIHTRRVNLFKQEQKEDQSFDQWHIHLYNLGEEAKVDDLTGRDWLLFLLIQSCRSTELRKKILNLPDA